MDPIIKTEKVWTVNVGAVVNKFVGHFSSFASFLSSLWAQFISIEVQAFIYMMFNSACQNRDWLYHYYDKWEGSDFLLPFLLTFNS